MKLNLGSGGKKHEGYVNVDNQPLEEPDVVCDLALARWPWEDNSVEEVIAAHILEHIGEGFFHFMQELYRVCAPGALVRIAVPHPRSDLYLNDPTHVRPITPTMLIMFSRGQWEKLERTGKRLTPFWKYLNVDFELQTRMKFAYDESVDPNDPELDWKIRHLNNIVAEYQMDLKVIKNV